MRTRLFTAEEQARTSERIHDVSQAFMWTPKRTLSAKSRSSLPSFAKVAAPLLIGALLVASGVFAWLGGDVVFPVLMTAVVLLLVATAAFLVHMTSSSERLSSLPPVFLFFEDKLFYVEQDRSSSTPHIPKIALGELMVLRSESGDALSNATTARIEAECYYIECAKELDIGNETPGLSITVIDDIVDVDVDEDDESTFIITYEDEYGDEAELRLPLGKWKELYDWLYQQMFAD